MPRFQFIVARAANEIADLRGSVDAADEAEARSLLAADTRLRDRTIVGLKEAGKLGPDDEDDEDEDDEEEDDHDYGEDEEEGDEEEEEEEDMDYASIEATPSAILEAVRHYMRYHQSEDDSRLSRVEVNYATNGDDEPFEEEYPAYRYTDSDGEGSLDSDIDEKLFELIRSVLDKAHPGWDSGLGSRGEFTLYADGRIEVKHYARFETLVETNV
jgi:hypothetical protein